MPPAAARLPRRVVVFVDRLYLPEPGRRTQLFDGLKDFLGRALGPGDEAMVVSWGDRVRVVRSFTGDLGSFYSIGFPASGGTKPAAVRVRAKREGLEVRTRATVAERTAEDQMRDRALANLFAPDENSRIGITVVAGEAKPEGKKYRIPVEVRIPVGSLVRLPGPASGIEVRDAAILPGLPRGRDGAE